MWRELVQPSSIRDDDDALELGGVVVDNPEYQLMLRRALNGFIR